MYVCYINIGYLILLASFTAFKLAHIIIKVQCLCVTNTIYIWAIPEKKKKNRWVEDMKFPGLLKSMWKFQGSIKKRNGISSGVHEKTCGISMGLHCFWHEFTRGVIHKILQNFHGVQAWGTRVKVTNLKIPGFFFPEKHMLNPLFFWNSPMLYFHNYFVCYIAILFVLM